MRNALVSIAFAFGCAALGVGCSSSTTVPVAPIATPTPPNAAALATPFAPVAFSVIPYGPQITAGYECYVGILTSTTQFPFIKTRARDSRGVQRVFVPSDGCDMFNMQSSYPTPPPAPPAPLGSVTFTTAQIVAPSLGVALPGVAGWSGVLTFPSCTACDAGTTNGSIALNVTQATTASKLAFSLRFKNTGPEVFAAATPDPSIRPAPHIYNLYGPVLPSPQPTPTYVSGAPVTLGFPTLAITVPSGSPIAPGKLVMTLAQIVTPPVYEEAIFNFDSSNNPLPIPLSESATYTPYTSNASTAYFALPSTPFPFQTDFTEYDFTLASS